MNDRRRRRVLGATCGLLLLLALLLWWRPGAESPTAPAEREALAATRITATPPPSHGFPPPVPGGLKPDPDSHWEVLPNGFRFVIQPRPLPAGRMSLRLLVEAGSLMEAEDQRAVAHFVEHMAFNGTRNFPPLEVFERFERLGMRKGADANASTFHDHTVYKLDLPNIAEETVAEAFLFFRDVADGVLFAQDEVESERKVVLSEARERRQRGDQVQRVLEGLLPESLLARRDPIGTDEVIGTVAVRRLVDFYRTYYTARRMVLVVVGECDHGETRARIADVFGSLPDLPRGEDPEMGTPSPGRGVVASATLPFDDMAILGAVRGVGAEPDSRAERLREMTLDLANRTATERRRELREGVSLKATKWWRMADFATVEFLATALRPSAWREDVSEMAKEWRSLRDSGFTPNEFALGRTGFLEKAIKEATERLRQDHREVANDIVRSLALKRVHLSPEDAFSLSLAAFRDVTREEAEAAWREAWDSEDVCLFLPANSKLSKHEDPVALLEKGWAQAVPPPEYGPVPDLDLKPVGEPGEVLARETFEDIGATVVTFRNGVRLNFRPLRTVAGVYQVRVSYGGGLLSTPPGARGIGTWAEHLFVHGGLPEARGYDLRRATAGSIMECGFKAGYDAFLLFGNGTADVMERHLALMTARLTRTDWEAGERLQRRSRSLEWLSFEWDHDPDLDAVMRRTFLPALAGRDARLLAPAAAEILARSATEIEEWHRPAARDEPLEITIVGDVTLTYAESKVAATFGTLPQRRTVRPEPSELQPSETEVPDIGSFTFRSGDRKKGAPGEKAGRLIKVFLLEKDIPPAEERALDLLAGVLDDRLNREIREVRGETYGCSVQARIHRDLGGLSYLTVTAGCRASRMEEVSAAVRELAGELAENGVTDDERERALRPLLATVDLQERDPGYWLAILDRCGRYPRQLDHARHSRRYLEETSLADLNRLARRHLHPARIREFRYVPEE